MIQKPKSCRNALLIPGNDIQTRKEAAFYFSPSKAEKGGFGKEGMRRRKMFPYYINNLIYYDNVAFPSLST